MSDKEILLVYDKECPACNRYCHMLRIRESVGHIELVDAREPSEIVDEITASGYDIDQGMVLKMGDALYYGSDAIHMLSLIGSPSGIFNRINYWAFRSKAVSKVVYPVLRFIRNLLLKILGRTRINNLHLDGNEKF
jgi:predicted DCC family thiol-disulfide oxidoreductase YuxK